VSFSPNVWNQLKNLTCVEIVSALTKDGWERDITTGAVQVYRKPNTNRIAIHYHPKKTYGAKLLKGLLDDIGWSEDDLRRLKLIK
jgi:predicted RNA binding protein YcfA (HicA-like mRNA interferase family)